MRTNTIFGSLLFVLLSATSWAATCPDVSLPWGIYHSTGSANNGATCVYQNVRFGKKPTRFQKPQSPDAVSSPVPQHTKAPTCFQVNLSPTRSSASVINTAGDVPPPFAGPLPGDDDEGGMSEDCLFADLYVPASAVNKPGTNLPVVVWLYGGAFIFGAKDAGLSDSMPFYNGAGLLSRGKDFIIVAGNYRLGAFGWLAGPVIAQKGVVNAGLWDQRLLLDFVTKHIPTFGGDPNHISLWGESAGAGSIMYHLTSSPPPATFRTALLQSPAYLWQWNPTSEGYAASVFNKIAAACNCGKSNDPVTCLQSVSGKQFQQCNTDVIRSEWKTTGLAPFNPAIDNMLIKHLPTVSLQNGNFMHLDSLVISHVFNESGSFVPDWIRSMTDFETFLTNFMPRDEYSKQRSAISAQYPTTRYLGDNGPRERAHDVIQDSSFICNTRFLFDAYHGASPATPAYMMQYAFGQNYGAAVHAADLFPTFLNKDASKKAFIKYMKETIRLTVSEFWIGVLFGLEQSLAGIYQAYLASFATSGRPQPASLTAWDSAVAGEQLSSVMEVSLWGWNNKYTDSQSSESICSFWRNMTYWVENTARSAELPTLLTQNIEIKDSLK